jgi:hypothetical protein
MRGVSSWGRQSIIPISPQIAPYLDILRQHPVEQVWVRGLEVDKVLEFLNWGGLHGKQSEACLGVSNTSLQVYTFQLTTDIVGFAPQSSQPPEGSSHMFPAGDEHRRGWRNHNLHSSSKADAGEGLAGQWKALCCD